MQSTTPSAAAIANDWNVDIIERDWDVRNSKSRRTVEVGWDSGGDNSSNNKIYSNYFDNKINNKAESIRLKAKFSAGMVVAIAVVSRAAVFCILVAVA